MLAEYRQLYETSILDSELKKEDKNELLMKYVETGEEKYLSAAIYKFWYILSNKVSNNKNNKFIEPEDFYNMFIDSILETCERNLWNNESHALYKDKKAPEKSINTIFNSKVINYFHACNRQKRKLSFEKIPLPTYNNDIYTYNISNDLLNVQKINSLIVDLFIKKDYYSSYILDLILNNNLFDKKGDELILNRKRLKHYLMNLDDSYFNYFSEYYNIDIDKVMFSYKYFKDISYENIDKKISNSLLVLSHNDELKSILKFYGEEQ